MLYHISQGCKNPFSVLWNYLSANYFARSNSQGTPKKRRHCKPIGKPADHSRATSTGDEPADKTCMKRITEQKSQGNPPQGEISSLGIIYSFRHFFPPTFS